MSFLRTSPLNALIIEATITDSGGARSFSDEDIVRRNVVKFIMHWAMVYPLPLCAF